MANLVNILNTIRQNASAEYQERIPEATRTNLETVASKLGTYESSMNEMLTSLVNRIAMTIIHQKMIKNPLEKLKKGSVPMGKDIEEIFVNPAIGEKYNYSSEDLLKVKIPDVKALYYGINRQDKYSVTITRPQLMKSLTSDADMGNLISVIVNSLYSGDNYDEFMLMKNLVKIASKNNHVKSETMDWDLATMTPENATQLVKAMKTDGGMMKFASSNYNSYDVVKPATDKGKSVITFTPIEDQVILIDSRVMTNISIDVLASAFNLDKADFMGQVIEVDNFIDEPILAMVCDKAWFRVFDNMIQTSSMYNGDTLSYKYWLHHWETLSYCMFANAKIYKYTPTTPQE